MSVQCTTAIGLVPQHPAWAACNVVLQCSCLRQWGSCVQSALIHRLPRCGSAATLLGLQSRLL